MIALGWCLAGQFIPSPLRLSSRDPVATICIPADAAPTPRDRLRLLQLAFDAGVDLMPLSAIREWPIEAAMEQADKASDDICIQIGRVSGKGQFTLRLAWPHDVAQQSRSPTPHCTGRSWLHERANSHGMRLAKAQAVAGMLAEFASDIAAPTSGVAPFTGGASIHFLLPRDSLSDLSRRIKHHGMGQNLPNGATASLTGPWPAFDFVHASEWVNA